MKQRIFLVLSAFLLIASMFFIVGCRQEEIFYDIDLPDENSLEGYYLYIDSSEYETKDFEKNEYRISANSSFYFRIVSKEGYTFENISVKDNGEIMEYEDASNEDTQTFRFGLENISENHIITVEGVKKIKCQVKMAFPKYKQQGSEEGIIYDESFDMLRIKYEDDFYNINSFINHINSQEIVLEYGEKLEFWLGEISPKYFESIYILYTASTENFDGIFATGDGIEFESLENLDAYWNFPVKQAGEYIYQDFMYKYEIEIKEDTTIYFNTLDLKKERYWAEWVNNDVYKFEVNEQNIFYDTEWSFDLTLTYYEEYPEMYEDIQIYINNTNITNWYELIFDDVEGKYHFTSKGYLPADYDDYQNSQSYKTFHLWVDGINLDANGDKEETKIIFNKNEYISQAYFYKKGDGDYSPYYCLNGDYYYLKTEEYIDVYFENSPVYDHSEMVVMVNGTPIVQGEEGNITLTKVNNTPDINNELFDYWRIRFEGEFEDVYEISVSGLSVRDLHYTAKNDYKNESKLYLILNDEKILIENEYHFTLIHEQVFLFEFIVESEAKAEEFEDYLTGILLNYRIGNYISRSYGVSDGAYSIEWRLKANAYGYEGNEVFEVVKK